MSLKLGRYETIRPIAAGGMAMVHLGRALGAGGFERLVALKVLHPHIEAEPEFVSMFLDEARLAARIRHPNVVATIDVSESPLFLVMDYVEGPSLHGVQRELKKRNEAVPLGVALRVMLDVLAGLDAAHELTDGEGRSLELVHRDVTPHNVLIGVDGIARITDFGVARAVARLSSTRGGQVKGKLAYMAPEQVRGEAIDRRTDVYAAGVVLHELLANEMLFSADNEAALVLQVATGAVHTARSKNAEVPEAIDRVCMRALASSPEERFTTASEFAEAIEEAARASGVRPASAKEVSGFVKLLAIHEAPGPMPGSGSSPKPSLPSSDPARAVSQPTAEQALRNTSSPSSLSSAFAPSSLNPPLPRTSWLKPTLGLGAVAAVTLGAWFALRTSTQDGSGSSPVVVATAPATPTAATAATVAVTPVVAPTTPSASATATATATASILANTASARPLGAPMQGAAAPRATQQPTSQGVTPPASTGTATGKPTAFRPSGL